MQLKVRITTPKGQAKGTQKKLQKFLLGIKKPQKVITNEDDSQIVWIMETDIRSALKIQRNVSFYDKLVEGIFKNRLLAKVVKKKVPKEQQDELEAMLKNQTKIEIIKNEPQN